MIKAEMEAKRKARQLALMQSLQGARPGTVDTRMQPLRTGQRQGGRLRQEYADELAEEEKQKKQEEKKKKKAATAF